MLQLVFQKLGYRLLKESYAIITIAGPTVAIKKDRNNNDCETNSGNKLFEIINPTNKLPEKSGVGNKNNHPNRPNIIEMYAMFSFMFFL